VTGAAAQWLRSQMALGKFEPSPIQQEAMARIYAGESCCIHAPTGTGKTLCYLLPLLQRFSEEAGRSPARGLRFLILLPTAALQVQTAALARALLGPGKAENVTLMRRDADNASEPSNIVIATPRQLRDLLDEPRTQPIWLSALGQVDMVVMDEADKLVNKWTMRQRKLAAREGRVLPAVAVLQEIELQTTKAGRRDEWQLVGATATLNRITFRNVKYSAGIDLSRIRAAGSELQQVEGQAAAGQYGDGTTSWPAAMRHRVRVPKPFIFPKVMAITARTISELQMKRILVVVATTGYAGRAPNSIYGRSLVVGQLRFRLEEYGKDVFDVISCSEAVEEAAKLWSVEGTMERTPKERSQCQVIVATAQEIRGIHLDFIDAVVLLGEPQSVGDYLHCAGRTCRYQPGSSEPEEGTVVSIVSDQTATKMLHWSRLSGFRLMEVPLNVHFTTGERVKRRQPRFSEEDVDAALEEFNIPDLPDIDGRWDEEDEDSDDAPPPSVWGG